MNKIYSAALVLLAVIIGVLTPISVWATWKQATQTSMIVNS